MIPFITILSITSQWYNTRKLPKSDEQISDGWCRSKKRRQLPHRPSQLNKKYL